jgi:L-lactate utilization protein LutB
MIHSKPAKKEKIRVSKKFPLQKKELIYFCSCCAVCLILLITSINLNSFLESKKVLGAKNEIESKEESLMTRELFWNNFLNSNPSYFDGWIELAKTNFELGNKEAGISALMKAKAINPNSDKIKEFEVSLAK